MFKKIGRWLSAFLGLLPMAAFADTSGPFSVSSADISVKILSQIFGGIMPDGGANAFGGAISTFNGAVLIVGGILATYTLLAGTLGTAHDGEMLGKKFSSVWIPIRYALGTALVLPVLNGGYCIMQQMVMWCILQGVGLANSVWISYLSSPNLTVPVQMTTAHKREVLNFANNVALAQICVQANASILNAGGTGGGLIDQISQSVMTYNYSVAYSADGATAYFGDQAGKLTLLTRSQCGSANLPQKPAAASVITPASAASGGKLGDISSAFALGDISPVYQAHIDQSKILITQLGTLASTAISSDTPVTAASVKLAADAYVIGVENAASGYANGNNSPFAGIIAASQTQGWILAGAWFTKLAMINQTLNDAVNSTPTASATWQLGDGFKFLDAIQPKIGVARTQILEAMNVSLPDSSSSEKDDSKGKQTQSSGMWSRMVQSVVEVFTGLDLQNLQNSTKHPVLVLQDAGNRMIAAWSLAATALMGVLAIAGIKVLGSGWDGGPVVFTLIGFAFLPIAGLVTLGFTLAYLLPNLPFLMWIGIVLGWLIMCVEAILAAPLWAVMHLHPNGDDLTGRGGNGYMLLLGLLLRPALTIFGLIAALVLTELMGEFVNKIFFSVFFSGSSSGWGTGLVTILSVVFSMTVYTSAMVQLFRKTFSLMHVIPDQLMRWIGGGQEQMGQYAGGLAEAGQKGVQAAASAGSFLGERSAQSAGQAISQAKSIQDGRAQRAQRDEAMKNEATSQEAALTQTLNDGGAGVSQINDRTSSDQAALNNANPMSQQGLTLRDSQSKMIKARSQGDAQVSQIPGGKQEFAEALVKGEAFGRTVASMEGSNSFEKEANFSAHVANGIQSQNQATQQAAQVTSQESQAQQLNVLNDISSKLGKQNDSTTTPSIVESKNISGGKSNLVQQLNMLDDIQATTQANAQNDLVNSATATNLNGELLNPGLAQTVATSSTVNPVGRGLTPNAANIVQHGGTTPSVSSATPNLSTSQAPIVDINSAEGHSTPNTTKTDSTSQVNISPTPSQSFDGSGGSGGYSTNNPNDFDV